MHLGGHLGPVAMVLGFHLLGSCLLVPGLSPILTLVSSSSHLVAFDVPKGPCLGSLHFHRPHQDHIHLVNESAPFYGFICSCPALILPPSPSSFSFFLTCVSNYSSPFSFLVCHI